MTDHLDDILFVIGLGLLSAGLAFVYWPLALIAPGAVLLLVGLLMGLRGGVDGGRE